MRQNLAALLCTLVLACLACPAEQPPPLTPARVGTVVGEVFADDVATAGVGGALVELYGTSARATTVEGKQFVLGSVPMGTHTLIVTQPATGLALRTEVSLAEAYQTVILPRAKTTLRRVALRGHVDVGGGTAAGIDVYLVGGSSQQLVRTGDDGNYSLGALPAGPVVIGYSKPGYAPWLQTLTLVEGDNAADDVVLQPTAAGDLSLSGVARLDGEVDHRGVAVLLNGGDQIVVTDAEGRFTFRELSPGLYTLRAEADGHRSVELAQVALDTAGQAHGLVDMFLAQGNDPAPASAAERGFEVSIISPMTGRSFEPGEEIAFLAEVQIADEAIPPSRVTWSRTGISPASPSVALGSGNPLLVDDVPVGLHQIAAVATAQDGATAAAQITVEVAPRVHVFTVDITSPIAGASVERGQPLVLLADARYDGQAVPASSVAWSADDCAAGATPVPLGSGNPLTVDSLLEGVHCLTATAAAGDGEAQSARTTVEVRPLQVDVSITSHRTNDPVLATVPLAMAAQIEVRDGVVIADSEVVWSVRPLGSADPWIEIGRGQNAVAVFPDIDVEELVEVQVVATVGGGLGQGRDTVALHLRPLRPGVAVSPGFTTVGVDVPVGQEVRDGDGQLLRIDYTMVQGQPVVLRVAQGVDLATAIAWSSDTGYLFSGDAAALDVLTEGVHELTLTVTGAQGLSGTLHIRVTVLPFHFGLTVLAPELTPATPYHVRSGLPLRVQVDHPYQQSFEWSRVRWFHPSAGQIASGWDSRAFNLPPGPGLVWVEVQDAVGNVARAYQEYVLQDIVFNATFVTPDDGLDVLEGTAVTLRVSCMHSLVPSVLAASALRVRYYSDVQGLLDDGAGASEFGVGDAVTVSDLVPGTHHLTARVHDGTLYAEALRTVYVRSPGVEASLVSPLDETMLFAGDPLVFEVIETHDAQVAPLYSWFLDGQEFDPTWGGYGSDAASSGRTRITLPAYDPASAPYTDPRWSVGSHDLTFQVRLPEVDASLGCVTIPGKATCLRLRLHLAPADADICPADNSDITIGAGQSVVWNGVRRLNCRVFVRDGGSLDVLPGSRILVAASGVVDERKLVIRSGTLTLGRPEASDSVIFQVQGLRATAGAWRGIQLTDGTANGDILVRLDHVVLRHGLYGLDASSTWGTAAHRAELRDVVIEDSSNGLSDFCPQILERTTFRNIGTTAIDESEVFGCSEQRAYTGLRFEGTHTALSLRSTGSVQLSDLRIDGANTGVTIYGTGAFELAIEDSTFARVRESSGAVGVLVSSASCVPLVLRGNRFVDNETAVRVAGCNAAIEQPLLVAVGNLFDGNATALRSENQIHATDEVHLNIFTGNGTNLALTGDGADLQAQGNDLGTPGDTTSTTGAALALPAGTIANLPRISDYFDLSSNERVVRFGNPLLQRPADLAALPVAYIREPQRTEAYHSGRCIPLRAESPLRGIDVQQDCQWWMDGEPGQGTALERDADGCLDTTRVLPDQGTHRVLLECVLRDALGIEVRRDRHETTLLVDDGGYSGRQWRPVEIWSGTVRLTGDIEIPASHTLILAPGTVVQIAANDLRRLERYPRWGDTTAANAGFGSRTLVDLFVDGTLLARGSEAAPVRLEPESGSTAAGQWGGVRVGRGGSAQLEHALVAGATLALHGEYRSDDPILVPDLQLIDATIEGADEAVRGVCPAALRRTAISDVGFVLRYAHCYQPLFSIDACDIHDVGGTSAGSYLDLYSYASNGPASAEVRLVDTVYDRGLGTRRGRAIDVDGYAEIASVKILNSSLRNFDIVFATTVPDTLLDVRNSTFTSVNTLLYSGYIAEGLIDHSTFDTALTLCAGTHCPKNLSVTRSRLVDVAEPIKGVTLGSHINGVFAFTGNQVEGATTVFGLAVSSTTNGAYAVDASGNNFLGTSGLVLNLNEQYLDGCGAGTAPHCSTDNNVVVDLDFTGNHFGVTSEAEIATLLDAPAMAIAGRRVDTTGWSATPLTLDLP